MPEKIIYTNSRGQSVELSNSEPFIVNKIEGMGNPPTEIHTQKSPFQDGTTYIDTNLEDREIEFEVMILANNQTQLFEYRRQLCEVFNPKLGLGTLTYFYDGGSKSVSCTVDSSPVFPSGKDNRGIGYQLAVFSLIGSPFWQDVTESKIEMAEVIPMFEFPLEITTEGIEFGSISGGYKTITNNGDVPAPLTIEFKGNVVNPIIKDVLTNEFIKINTTIVEGETLIITTEFGNKKVVLIDVNGNELNKFGYIDLDSTFFNLKVGDNYLTYDADSGADSSNVIIKYKQLYVGV